MSAAAQEAIRVYNSPTNSSTSKMLYSFARSKRFTVDRKNLWVLTFPNLTQLGVPRFAMTFQPWGPKEPPRSVMAKNTILERRWVTIQDPPNTKNLQSSRQTSERTLGRHLAPQGKQWRQLARSSWEQVSLAPAVTEPTPISRISAIPWGPRPWTHVNFLKKHWFTPLDSYTTAREVPGPGRYKMIQGINTDGK